MGQSLRTALSCGLVEAIAGDPDWNLTLDGPQRSAAYRTRLHQSDVEGSRADLAESESKCRELEHQIAEYNSDALQNFSVAENVNLLPEERANAMNRAKTSYQLLQRTKTQLQSERNILQQIRSVLLSVDVVQRGSERRHVFDRLERVARGANTSEKSRERLTDAIDNVAREHGELRQAESEYNDAIASTAAVDETYAGSGFDLNDPGQLRKALQQLKGAQTAPAAAAAENWNTAGPSPMRMDSASVMSRAPMAPSGTPAASTRHAVTTSGQIKPVGGKTRYNKEDDDLENIF